LILENQLTVRADKQLLVMDRRYFLTVRARSGYRYIVFSMAPDCQIHSFCELVASGHDQPVVFTGEVELAVPFVGSEPRKLLALSGAPIAVCCVLAQIGQHGDSDRPGL
jgi:hypothetical protein